MNICILYNKKKRAFLQVFHLIVDLNMLYLDHGVRMRSRGFSSAFDLIHQSSLVLYLLRLEKFK